MWIDFAVRQNEYSNFQIKLFDVMLKWFEYFDERHSYFGVVFFIFIVIDIAGMQKWHKLKTLQGIAVYYTVSKHCTNLAKQRFVYIKTYNKLMFLRANRSYVTDQRLVNAF